MKLVKKTKDGLSWGVHAPPQPRWADVVTKQLLGDAEEFANKVKMQAEYAPPKELDKLEKIVQDIVKNIQKQKQINKSL